MHPYGSDRVRAAGGKVILHSPLAKGWRARVAKTNTSAEFPGTAVLWDDHYFEVLEATPLDSGAVRYVLAPWPDQHTIRTFEPYDAASEERRREDFERARRQRRASGSSRLAGILLGHLPEPVQNHLRDELGVVPSRMTLLSCVIPVAFVGACVWRRAGAAIAQQASPVPQWLWFVCAYLLVESAIRFYTAMSQSRAMGSLLGGILYLAFWSLRRNRAKLPSPFASRGENYKTIIIPPPDDVALRDSIEMRAPLLTLLTPAEQRELAQRYGFDYRRHAAVFAWTILVVAVAGVVTSYMKVSTAATLSALLSMFCAAAVAIEQVARLLAFKRGPAGSIFGALVRPFVRDLFTARN